MQTRQATLILASFLSSPRRFRSYELSKAAKQLIVSIQHLLETYEKKNLSSNYLEALIDLNEAYQLLGAEPPPATSDDLTSRKHPVLVAFDNPNPRAETDALKAFLNDLRKEAEAKATGFAEPVQEHHVQHSDEPPRDYAADATTMLNEGLSPEDTHEKLVAAGMDGEAATALLQQLLDRRAKKALRASNAKFKAEQKRSKAKTLAAAASIFVVGVLLFVGNVTGVLRTIPLLSYAAMGVGATLGAWAYR